jgi:hypothetical protein
VSEQIDTATMRDNLVQSLMQSWQAQREWFENREPSASEIAAKDERGTVRQEVRRDLDEAPEELLQAVSWFASVLEEVPAEFQMSATVEARQSEYDAGFDVTWQRPETDEEWAARKADVERREAIWKERHEAQERAEFERLSKKFGA